MSSPISLAEEYGASNYAPLPITLVRGEGCFVWDDAGRRYVDMLAAYSALNQGHRHPRIVQALVEQAGKITLTSRAFHNEQMGGLLEQLCSLSGYPKALLMNSGAEAVETAIKMARKWGYLVKNVKPDQARIVVCDGNFHGRTTTIAGFSSEPQYRDGFGPFTPGFDIIPYGSIATLERALRHETVAFLVEPVQGEAGIVIPPTGYLAEAAKLCHKYGVLLMADEIQTGFGRTGSLFGYQHDGAKPDVLILGKALGGGVYPISAVLAAAEVMAVFKPGDHGSTFGGNPLACAVARAALSVIVDEKLPDRSEKLGHHAIAALKSIRSDRIKEVRGRGLFIGVELRRESGPARPACEELMCRGILAKETHGQVIRLAPPLVIDEKTLDEAVSVISDVLSVSSR